jgi:signal transduction histidine kinase
MSGPLDIVPQPLAQHAEAVLRELVSNAVRHSKAAEVAITISVADDLVIDVADNGIGIPDIIARSGLHNITRRALETGGTCTVHRVETGGTHITWSAPLPGH